MDKEHVWIKQDNGDILYCEIKAIHRDERYQLIEYEVFPIIGYFKGFTTSLNGGLSNPTRCMIWIYPEKPFGQACYNLDRLVNGK